MEIKPIHLRFFTKKKSRLCSTHVLYMRICLDKQRTDICLKYNLQREAWDEQLQRLKGRNSDQAFVTGLMNQYRQRTLSIYQDHIQQGQFVNVHQIRQFLTGKSIQKNVNPTLTELFERVIDRKQKLAGKNNSKATIQKYNRCLKHLKSFVKKQFKQTDIKFEQLNLLFIEDFEVHLKTMGACAHNTSMKHIQTLKTIMRTALIHGYIKKDPFAGYRIRMEEVVRWYLTLDELSSLIKIDPPRKSLQRVRDFFVFCCFTGLSYVDLYGLQLKHIQFENGQYWIRTRREKTKVQTNVPLLDVPLKILQKYTSEVELRLNTDETVFPVCSNQKMNAHLKELADACQITKTLTCHIARHTFATTVTLSNGVPIESVSSMLGHKKIATTQHYAKILDRKVEEDMAQLALKLSQKCI